MARYQILLWSCRILSFWKLNFTLLFFIDIFLEESVFIYKWKNKDSCSNYKVTIDDILPEHVEIPGLHNYEKLFSETDLVLRGIPQSLYTSQINLIVSSIDQLVGSLPVDINIGININLFSFAVSKYWQYSLFSMLNWPSWLRVISLLKLPSVVIFRLVQYFFEVTGLIFT